MLERCQKQPFTDRNNIVQSGQTMFRQSLLFLLFLSPIPLAAQQTAPYPNPCDEQPPSQRQMDACAGFQYRQADARLNKVYQKAMEYMTNDQSRAKKNNDQRQVQYEKTAVESLQQAERAWLSYRELQCKAAGQQYEGGSMRPMIESQCLTTLTAHRIADIKSVYEDGDRKLD
jgi:uncharacterized protein YecT (DUF1311 family)